MRHLITRLLAWGVMAALAYQLAIHLPLGLAMLAWIGLAALLCGLGAFLMSRQPVGVATMPGQFGAGLLRWGYQIGGGQLPGVAAVSWLVWSIIGAGLIGALQSFDRRTILMIAAWEIDALALLFLIGLVILARQARRPMPKSFVVPLLALSVMLAGSAFLWQQETDASQTRALLLGGGPIPLLLLAYGALIATMMLGGRKGGWR